MTNGLPRELSDPALLEEMAVRCARIEETIRSEVGEKDARYIYRVLWLVRGLEISGRLLIFCFFFPPLWAMGVFLLALSKIIENTELGHNVMHGQYDWLGDPRLNGESYEMDAVVTGLGWRKAHNDNHHAYTAIEGVDNDVGFLRFNAEQEWKPRHLLQPVFALLSALFAQWAVALQNVRLGDYFAGRCSAEDVLLSFRAIMRKAGIHLFKDYVLFPLVAGPHFLAVFLGNLIANAMRNLWVWLIIACGHCVSGVRTFKEEELAGLPEEHLIVRQILGAANFSCGRFMRVVTGHLGYHIEHHLFPSLPSYRYPALSRKVRGLCEEYGIPYNSRPLATRIPEVIWAVLIYSLPIKRADSTRHTPPAAR